MEQKDTILVLEDLMSACIGTVGEVQTEDNRILFVGRVTAYDKGQQELEIQLHRGSETPRGVLHRMPVKVQIHPGRGWESVAVLYGEVSACAEDYWKIAIKNMVVCAENRRAFRQKVRAEGWVFWGEKLQNRAQCQLADISLVGVGFTSKAELPVGDRVQLTLPQLRENGPEYQLTCTVVGRRNTAPEGMPPLWHYGGDFGGLDRRLESQLCRDILALQAKSVNRKQ